MPLGDYILQPMSVCGRERAAKRAHQKLVLLEKAVLRGRLDAFLGVRDMIRVDDRKRNTEA